MDNIKSIGKDVHIMLCVMAVIVSSIIINILIKSGHSMDGFVVGRDNYEVLMSSDFVEAVFLTLFTRLKQFAVVFVLYRLINSELAYNGIIGCCSFVAGGMVCVQTFYGGLTGVFELMMFLFPHYIFYFLTVRTMYIRIKRSGKTGTGGFAVAFSFFIVGIICELFFSKIFLNEFYQYLVLG
jgi:hypothetical protein